jgi:hypothetical protein
MSPKYIEEQRSDPNRDPRHYENMGRLDPKPRPEPKITRLSDSGINIMNSWLPLVKADGKRPIAVATALLLAAGVGWGAYELGKARGYIEGTALCRPHTKD